MSKVSIIIPARNEKYLLRTLQDIYEKATGDFEVIVGFNGGPTQEQSKFLNQHPYPNFKWYSALPQIGLKPMVNKIASMATGKYLLKADAHTMWGEGFDEILQADMEDNWVVTPRFYVLDAEKWQVQDERFYDYFYLCCPFTDKRGLRFKAGGHWLERTQDRLNKHYYNSINYPDGLDETPQMHGSGWFVNRDYFLNTLGGFPEADPLGHAQEPIWLGLKNWLIGGKLMVNKNTWYAHLHQDSNQRGYPEDKTHTEETYKWTADYFLTNSLENRIHDFDWFVKKFMPMPSWSEDWEAHYAEYLKLHS